MIQTPTETPMLRQYLDIKSGHKDAILFFRLGDFYEMFLEDATIASETLSLTLTGRGKDENRIPMCGIPYHAADSYIAKLVDHGFKVAICEQVEDPALSKGITKREVVRIITPGTTLQTSSLEEDGNNYMVAIQEKPDKRVCLAFCDNGTGEFKVTECANREDAFVSLYFLNPKEVIIPIDQSWEFSTTLLINPVQFIGLADATRLLQDFFEIHSLEGFGITSFKDSLSAAWALLSYIQSTQKHRLSQFTRLQEWTQDDGMILDAVTIHTLELNRSRDQKNNQNTLFSTLNYGKTAMGKRRLKQAILRPLHNASLIQDRWETVGYLRDDLLSREEIRECLAGLPDLERLSSRIVSKRDNPKEVLALAESIQSLASLGPILKQTSGSLLHTLEAFFTKAFSQEAPLPKLISHIQKAIRTDCPSISRDGQIINRHYDESLDTLLDSFQSIKDWIAALEEQERQATGIKSLKVGFNKIFGYYIEIPNSQLGSIPSHYMRKQTLSHAERFITSELKEKETILLTGEEKQIQLEKTLFLEIVSHIDAHIGFIQELAHHVSWLDFYQSLATVAQKNGYVQPHIAEKKEKECTIIQGRHPILDTNPSLQFIPNSIHMSHDKNRFILLTGPNMAGKSTLMRQVALLIIMAQMGSFVPAQAMRLSLVDRLFTRVGALDNLYAGQSTFMVEMLETATILHNATPDSMIILDEIGRGTATYDGMSIASAVAEHIHHDIQARTVFATHYHELTTMGDKDPSFSNFSMHISETNGRLIFTHQLKEGPADKSYGLHVAQMAGLPKSVLSRASVLLQKFESSQQEKPPQQLRLFE